MRRERSVGSVFLLTGQVVEITMYCRYVNPPCSQHIKMSSHNPTMSKMDEPLMK